MVPAPSPERPLVDEPEVETGIEPGTDAQMLLGRQFRWLHEHLTTHAEMHHKSDRAGFEDQPQILSTTVGARDAFAGELSGEVCGAGQMPPDRPRVQDVDGIDRRPHDVAFESAPDHLDFG